jgi:sec-independent protein translocase protein TatB
MNVFGVGPLELVVVILVALIVVGPERLPRLAADLARTIRDIRKYTGSIAAEFNDVIKDIEKETEAERAEWKEVGRGLGDASSDVGRAVEAARADAESATPPPSADGSEAHAAAEKGT